MNTGKLLMLGLVSALMCSSYALGKEAEHAHIASPDKYEVLLDNDQVLVLRMTLRPGEHDLWHKHNAETVYFERGGKARIKTADGKQLALEIPDGHTMWHDQWEHQVFNLGETTIMAIIVERK
ncbi:hypothetical protein WCN91_04375 [Pseudoalteromonas sp. YIC-827]|uniref:Cupin domain-containing protein n=1 Tax=Pseudoalteromonas qingdaonensis TaxID=3131913 RepID=A0ABU9MTQ2_9GAMM|nr:hypothetical protein [Pseudoalteromonas sp. T1lg48]